MTGVGTSARGRGALHSGEGSRTLSGSLARLRTSLAEIATNRCPVCDDVAGEHDPGPYGSSMALEQHAELIDALHQEPGRRDLAWRLGLDEQVTDPGRRQTELRNFIELAVKPNRSARGRA